MLNFPTPKKMLNFFLLISVVLLAAPVFAQESLSPFDTDYCTNYPEGTRSRPELWKHCCLYHDLAFWAGGNKQNRYDADRELKSCIQEAGAPVIAQMMYLGVRAGSYSPLKYPEKKWNNGWRERVTYRSLTVEDIDRIEAELMSSYDFISPELKNDFIHKLRLRLE
jgi:hypothetical protein